MYENLEDFVPPREIPVGKTVENIHRGPNECEPITKYNMAYFVPILETLKVLCKKP